MLMSKEMDTDSWLDETLEALTERVSLQMTNMSLSPELTAQLIKNAEDDAKAQIVAKMESAEKRGEVSLANKVQMKMSYNLAEYNIRYYNWQEVEEMLAALTHPTPQKEGDDE
jgi:hypothetical protein